MSYFKAFKFAHLFHFSLASESSNRLVLVFPNRCTFKVKLYSVS